MRCFFICLLLTQALASAQTVTVFAAASLGESFGAIAALFEAANPGAQVTVSTAGSALLATQINQGAPADLFASADLDTLLRVVSGDRAVLFAQNEITVVVRLESGIRDLKALAEESYLLVLAAEEVPAGRYARRALGALNGIYGEGYSEQVLANLASTETNVRQVAAKVELGEADAGFVYRSDLEALEGVLELPLSMLPPEAVSAQYYAAALPGAADAELTARFLNFLLSPAAQAILSEHGFDAPN